MAPTEKKTGVPDAELDSTISKPSRSNTAVTVETDYVRMLLELQNIHWGYNALAGFAAWILLAGYLVIPGTFTSLQKSDTFQGKEAQDDMESVVQATVQNPPLVAIAWTFLAIGSGTMGLLFYRWRNNYIWLINRLFIPTFLNTAAGLLTTIVNIYTARNGDWSVMAVVTVTLCGTLAAASLGLTIAYKFWKLRIITEEHERESQAGLGQVYVGNSH